MFYHSTIDLMTNSGDPQVYSVRVQRVLKLTIYTTIISRCNLL